MTDMTEIATETGRSLDAEDGVKRTPCQLADLDIWFTPSSEKVALAACRECPAREVCLRVAMNANGADHTSSRFGVWGGLTPVQRPARAGRRACAEAGGR